MTDAKQKPDLARYVLSKGAPANVEFYTALVLQAIGLPPATFVAMLHAAAVPAGVRT